MITKLVFRLIPAKAFVQLDYETHATFASLSKRLEECSDAGIDFVDAIAHSDSMFILCLGRFVDSAPYRSDYSGQHIYYRSTSERTRDYLTSYDYFFRFDTDCHWASRVIPGMQSAMGRRLFGRFFLGSTRMMNWSRRLRPLERLRRSVPLVTDVFIPRDRAEEFHAWYRETVDFYPLWIVPYTMRAPYDWIAEDSSARTVTDFVDFAVYGAPNDRPGIDLAELVERKTQEMGGIKTLIGDNHYDEDAFWQIYHRPNYERAKQRLDPDNLFRTVFEKRVTGPSRRGSTRKSSRIPSDPQQPGRAAAKGGIFDFG